MKRTLLLVPQGQQIALQAEMAALMIDTFSIYDVVGIEFILIEVSSTETATIFRVVI